MRLITASKSPVYSQEKSLYENFDKIELIGCCCVDKNLSTTY